MALNEYTDRQTQSSGDCRDQAVLKCLATVADNPDTLPSFGLYAAGIATFTDSVTLGHTVTWGPAQYTMEALGLTGFRSPKEQWTIDPTAEYEKIMATHAACLWGVFGPERLSEQYMSILGKQEDYLDQKPHFAVKDRLAKLPPGWLHYGSEKAVPACVRYKAHKGKTWVWVMPADHEAFAQFTLALQDVATLDIAAYYSPPPVIKLTTYYVTKIPDVSDSSKATTIATNEYRAVRPEFKEEIEKLINKSITSGEPIKLTRAQWLRYTELYTGTRSTATGTPTASLPARAPIGPSTPSGQPPGFNRPSMPEMFPLN